MQYVNKKLVLTLDNGRDILGTLLAFDKHMNVVLSDATETRNKPGTGTISRELGLVVIRGDNVVSVRAVPRAKKVEEDPATSARGKTKPVAVKPN